MTVVIELTKVRLAMSMWRSNAPDPLAGLTSEERSVALVALGYDTPAHAQMVGIPPDHLRAARDIAARLAS